ncbi:addiction module protein [Luteolibacter flavescens]|uniref:addiction module protein n=1 Tax=Luteolibacter flavescens TaxID=1859460 RepID=UPI0022226F70|nr:addiction module protein [Luteolibacter flavescens]
MPATAEQLYRDALTLSPEARADLTDRLVASSAEAIVSDIEEAHLAEVRRRIAGVGTGEHRLIEGQQVLSAGRAFLGSLIENGSGR